jgi:pimeloyl-ACP methyl ester carboxylesterase
MGCIEAANISAKHPDRIVASVWIGPVLPSPEGAAVFEKRIATVESEGMEPMANTIPRAATAKSASTLAHAFIRELLLAQDPLGYVSNCRVIARAKPQDYAGIKVPVLIVAGEEDKSAPLEGCKKMFNMLGTEEKRLEVMERVGHWHCIEAPEGVAKLIVDFYHQIQ